MAGLPSDRPRASTMDTTPTPDDDTPAPAPTGARRRRVSLGAILLVAIFSVALAVGIVLAFRPSGSSTGTGVIKLDPDATEPFNGLTGGTDVVGQSAHGVTYLGFDATQHPIHDGDRPVLLNFWSSTCAPCIREMPALQAASLAQAGAIEVIGIDYVEVPELGQKMIDLTGVTYPVGRDPKGTLMRSFGGNALPYTVLIGRDGTILATHAGALDAAAIDALIAQGLAS